MKMTKKMIQERLDSIAHKSACSRWGRRGRGERISSSGGMAWTGGPVQKALKTASKYAENGYLFTPIQF